MSNVIYLSMTRHPKAERPLIDYEVTCYLDYEVSSCVVCVGYDNGYAQLGTLMASSELLGVNIGVICNVILSTTSILIILFVVLSFNSVLVGLLA